MTGSIHVVIVNWNTGSHLAGCLRSIAEADGPGVRIARVTVVDNASSDDSASLSDTSSLPLPLELIENDENIGFGAACNQGAANSEADYLLFLNPDTRLFPETLERVVAFMDEEEAGGVGICGVDIVGIDGEPGISAERFPTFRIVFGKMTRLDRVLPRCFPRHHLTPRETSAGGRVDQIIGAFYVVRRELFERLGGFDLRYFIYYEDVDFALRARQAGYGSYLLKGAKVMHAENVSSDQVRDVRLYQSLRSRLLYARAHWPRRQARALVALTFAVEFPGRLAQAVWHRSGSEVRETMSGYLMLLRDPVLRQSSATWR